MEETRSGNGGLGTAYLLPVRNPYQPISAPKTQNIPNWCFQHYVVNFRREGIERPSSLGTMGGVMAFSFLGGGGQGDVLLKWHRSACRCSAFPRGYRHADEIQTVWGQGTYTDPEHRSGVGFYVDRMGAKRRGAEGTIRQSQSIHCPSETREFIR